MDDDAMSLLRREGAGQPLTDETIQAAAAACRRLAAAQSDRISPPAFGGPGPVPPEGEPDTRPAAPPPGEAFDPLPPQNRGNARSFSFKDPLAAKPDEVGLVLGGPDFDVWDKLIGYVLGYGVVFDSWHESVSGVFGKNKNSGEFFVGEGSGAVDDVDLSFYLRDRGRALAVTAEFEAKDRAFRPLPGKAGHDEALGRAIGRGPHRVGLAVP